MPFYYIVKVSPKKKPPPTARPMWEKVNQEEIGEARVEQMRKMFDAKSTMPAKEAAYYDKVSILKHHFNNLINAQKCPNLNPKVFRYCYLDDIEQFH